MKKALLFVDDSVIIRLSVTKILRENDYEVTTCKEGKEALKTFKEDHFDLVLTDLEMNGMSGDELIKEIRIIDKKIPIIVMSDRYETIAINEDIQAFLNKHISARKLIETIEEVLNKSEQERS